MAVERKFIEDTMKKVRIDRYVRAELKKVGVGDVQVKRTPLGTRIMVEAVRPGLVIGRKGKNIQMLTDSIKKKFSVDNPELEVAEISIPELNPGIMAQRLAQTLEARVHFRRACYNMLQQIMRAGALGAMIIVSGKISGTRARSEKFKAGYIRYCGEPALIYVKEAIAQANMKSGIIGVQIKIMPQIEKAVDALELVDVKSANEGKPVEVEQVTEGETGKNKKEVIKEEQGKTKKKRAPSKKQAGKSAKEEK